MRILLCCFACSPNTGSEGGVGWRYATALCQKHDVWVLTDISRRDAIEQSALSNHPRLHFIYYRPSWISGLSLNSKTAHVIYQLWLRSSLPVAEKLDKEVNFDICWHLTYGVFRQANPLWKLGKPFVFGPVGGGESAPIRLWRSLPFGEIVREISRDLINHLALCQPALRRMYAHAALVIARTEETRDLLPSSMRNRVVIQHEVGGYPGAKFVRQPRDTTKPVRLLFAGRLLGWKGVHLAIRAVHDYILRGHACVFSIAGSGPMYDVLVRLVKQLDLEHCVHFLGQLNQTELFSLYETHDVLLFPSLHDAGPNVILEAMSYSMPVICLDLGGPKYFVDDTCGVVLGARTISENMLVCEISKAIESISLNDKMYEKLSIGASNKINALSWEKQIYKVLSLVENVVN
ncbi:glycosyltransferase [Aeromonas allosaccharophila]